MRKIYFFGPNNEETSLGIYTRELMKAIAKNGDFEIIDNRRNIAGFGFLKSAFTAILDSFHLIFGGGKYYENDIIIIPHTANVFPPMFLGKKKNVFHIAHDFFYYDEEFFSQLGWFHKNIFYPFYYLKIHKWLYKIAFRHAEGIIAISQATKNETIQKFGEEFRNKITVIYNGMNQEIFNENNLGSLSPSEIPNKKYILYIGSELDRKNLKNIIAGFAIFQKNHKDYIFVKAPSEGWEIYRNKTREYVQNSGLKIGENFVFLDRYFQANELVSLYKNAEIFVFASLKEGFGFPIIEAELCGTPVVTSNIEPMIELVPYKNMTANPHSPEDIAQKMEQIIHNPELKKQMITEGKSFAKQFSWDKTAKECIQLFDKK